MLQGIIRWTRAVWLLLSVYGAMPGAVPGTAAAEASAMPSADTPSVQESAFRFEPLPRGADNALKEFGSARSDHAAIALEISQCYKETVDPLRWSPSVRALLLFELDENSMHVVPANAAGVEAPAQAHLPALAPFHSAAILFSDRVSRDRLAFRKDLEDSRIRAEVYQVLIVLLGAAATILVSVRAATQGNTRTSQIVGIFAISFSALGTAASSMSSFEGSTAVALRDQRALSQLQQLHWRIASDVLRKPELCGHAGSASEASTRDAIEIVNAWRNRLEAILDGAVDSISKPGDISTGVMPAKPSPSDQNNKPMSTASSESAG